MKKKKILFLLLTLFLLYIFWLSYQLLTFKIYKTPFSNSSPLEIEGVYHIHTIFSDGRKHPDQIAKMASLASLDFIILTDHGRPNFRSLHSQGWKEGVLVLVGSELSVNRGHLVGLGFETPPWHFSRIAENAVYEIKEKKGFSIIAHPYSRVPWSWGKFIEYSGIEVMNGHAMLIKGFYSSFPFFPALLVKPEYTLLRILDSPQRNLRKWDELNTIHPIYGYFSTDAHLLYGPLFNLFRLHVILEKPLSEDFKIARDQVHHALSEGRFYNAIHAAAKAKGFRFMGEKKGEMIPMGHTILLDSPVTLHIKTPFSFAIETHLIHNGKIIFQSIEKSISYEADSPGTYRVEVYLKEKSPMNKSVPWIISNPIFLRKEEK